MYLEYMLHGHWEVLYGFIKLLYKFVLLKDFTYGRENPYCIIKKIRAIIIYIYYCSFIFPHNIRLRFFNLVIYTN